MKTVPRPERSESVPTKSTVSCYPVGWEKREFVPARSEAQGQAVTWGFSQKVDQCLPHFKHSS